jgi:N-acetylglucosamine-6-sulfatase
MHVSENKVNNATFAKHLQAAGYTVGMFGKYLNNVPNYVPEGFDSWMANGGGNYFSPSFATFNAPGLPDGHWQGTSANYTTSAVGNVSTAWIRHVAHGDKPFFAYVAPKAAHEPFDPAPWYHDHWDPAWPAHEPRPVNWNASFASRADHHGNIATEPLITEEAAKVITGVFKNRWRTLMSVDDLIAALFAECESLGILDNTYIFYSSDHGFQVGAVYSVDTVPCALGSRRSLREGTLARGLPR